MIRRPAPSPRRRLLSVLGGLAVPVVGLAVGLGASHARVETPGRPPPPVLRRQFTAAGGRITARIIVGGRTACPVELLGGGGRLLAAGRARPATRLEARAAAGTAVAIVLRPASSEPFSWQVTATGLDP